MNDDEMAILFTDQARFKTKSMRYVEEFENIVMKNLHDNRTLQSAKLSPFHLYALTGDANFEGIYRTNIYVVCAIALSPAFAQVAGDGSVYYDEVWNFAK